MPAAAEIDVVILEQTVPQLQPSAPFIDMRALEQALGDAVDDDGETIEERYPLLRHAL
jgi:uncharacterized protein with von Willebrand factor type A (vWA) domain